MESNQGQSFASPNDDGFWVDNKQKALNVSASDLERYTYCPLSWALAKEGATGKGEAIEK